MLSPNLSLHDKAQIKGWISSREIFPAIVDSAARHRILQELLGIEGRIPSLFTFFEDTKYLETWVKAVRKLIPTKFKGTIKQALRKTYMNSGKREHVKIDIQVWESHFKSIHGSQETRLEVGYLQLWLFAMRHFPYLTGTTPKKDRGNPKPEVELREGLWHEFGALALRLGFQSREIMELERQDPIERMVHSFLKRALPYDLYDLGTIARSDTQRISDIIKSIPSRIGMSETPLLSDDVNQLPLMHRCGKPYERSYLRDRKYLFLENIYVIEEAQLRQYITSFTVKRDIFRAFFDLSFYAMGEIQQGSVADSPKGTQSRQQDSKHPAPAEEPMDVQEHKEDSKPPTVADEAMDVGGSASVRDNSQQQASARSRDPSPLTFTIQGTTPTDVQEHKEEAEPSTVADERMDVQEHKEDPKSLVVADKVVDVGSSAFVRDNSQQRASVTAVKRVFEDNKQQSQDFPVFLTPQRSGPFHFNRSSFERNLSSLKQQYTLLYNYNNNTYYIFPFGHPSLRAVVQELTAQCYGFSVKVGDGSKFIMSRQCAEEKLVFVGKKGDDHRRIISDSVKEAIEVILHLVETKRQKQTTKMVEQVGSEVERFLQAEPFNYEIEL